MSPTQGGISSFICYLFTAADDNLVLGALKLPGNRIVLLDVSLIQKTSF